MEQKNVGAQTRRLRTCPSVLSFAAVGGRFEGEGPLREYFDELSEDHFFGEKTWEKGESTMQRHALSRALEKVGLKVSDLDLIFAGDLLNQCVGSSFALRESRIPFYGLYGACSTMGESLSLAALMLDGGYASCAAALTSSHFCTAERQYRMPVPYGSQRTPTAQWTATGSGCCLLACEGEGPYITHVTTGKIVDKGVTDANNMGAAIANATSGGSMAVLAVSVLQTLMSLYLTLFVLGAITTVTEWKNIRCAAWKKVLYAFTFPLFMLTYVPICIASLFTKVEWKPICHTRVMTLEQIEEPGLRAS